MNLPTANEVICEYSRAGLRPTSRTVCYEQDGKCCAIGVLERSEDDRVTPYNHNG